jgi:hypothetical protein
VNETEHPPVPADTPPPAIRTHALLDDTGTVTEVMDFAEGVPLPGVDITDEPTKPEPGWVYRDGAFSEPQTHRNRRMLDQRLDQAVARNQTYLAIPNPTQAQLATQVNALTNQVQALIRLYRQHLDDTT